MADDNGTNWIFLEDAPEDLRGHTLLRHHLRNREEMFDALKSPEMDYLRKVNIVDASGNFLPRSEKDRAPATPAQKAVDLKTFAAEFAKKLLAELPEAELPKYVAPSRHLQSRKRGPAPTFAARNPRFEAARHQKYLDAGHRRLCAVAASEHRPAQYASHMRCEIVLCAITSGEPVPFTIASPRVKFPPEDEMPLACGMFPILWQAHEAALIEAEHRHLINDGTKRPLLSTRGRLLYDLFRATTELKIDNAVATYSRLFKALGPILDACREELRQR